MPDMKRTRKYNEAVVNRLAKLDSLLSQNGGEATARHGWTKELSAAWTERNKLRIEVSRMETKA